jgi:dihydrofolate reductase
MGKVMVMSVSLDGFIAGANDGREFPLGEGGEALFAWMGDDGGTPAGEWGTSEASRVVVDEWTSQAGAMISGRRTFDIAGGWAGGHPIDAPIFVLTHEAPTASGAHGSSSSRGVWTGLSSWPRRRQATRSCPPVVRTWRSNCSEAVASTRSR